MNEGASPDRPLWWRKHYQVYDDPQIQGGHFDLSPFYQPAGGPLPNTSRAFSSRSNLRQNISPLRLGASKPRQVLDPVAQSQDDSDHARAHLRRLDQYKRIVDRLKANEAIANKYTGKKFSSTELIHPNLWFPESSGQQETEMDPELSEFDSFWLNKHLYMHSIDVPKNDMSQDDILSVRLAREAKRMNKKMTKEYDKQRLQILEREREISENQKQIRALEQKIEKLENHSKQFEEAFVEANSEVIKKLDEFSTEQKLLNSRLLQSVPTNRSESLSLLTPLNFPYLEGKVTSKATDPVWERTRLFLENEKDKARYDKLQLTYLNTLKGR